jgi:hypothetical protein
MNKTTSLQKLPGYGSVPKDSQLVTLKYGAANNFSKYRDHIMDRLTQQFSLEASFIETGFYAIVDRPIDPQRISNAAVFSALDLRSKENEISDYEWNLNSYREDCKDRTYIRPQIFSAINESLSVESKSKIMSDPTWQDVHKDKDPLKLWLLIKSTHEGDGDLLIKPYLLVKAAASLYAIKMGPQESPFALKVRFDEAIKKYKLQRGAEPDQLEQAAIFALALDPLRYAAFDSELVNSIQHKLYPFPPTLQAMYEDVVAWKAGPTTSKATVSGVFAVKQKNLKKKRL